MSTVSIELSGGLEYLFNKVKHHKITVTEENPNIGHVLAAMKAKLVERPELFMQEETVRPGILVLINDSDWELEGGVTAPVKDGDKIVFISTLHGG